MRQIIRGILPLFLLFFSAVAIASPEARYHLLKIDYKLNEDGSQEYHFRKELSIYTHPAMNNTYGETFVVYNPDYQTLKVNESYTRQSDGTIIENPQNAFVKQLPSAAARAPYYNRITEMAIVHTGLDLGCTIYLDYTITTKPGYLPALDLSLPLEARAPIDRAEVSITVPSSQNLDFAEYGLLRSGKKEVIDGRTVYSWILKKLPETMPEAYAPASCLLVASTWKDADAAAAYIGSQCDKGALAQLPGDLQTALDTCRDVSSRLAAIASYVQAHVETCALSLAGCGYRIRPCKEVLETAYGTEAEKASLLYNLLKAAGMKVQLTLKSVLPPALAGKVAALSGVEGLAVRVGDGGTVWEIDPASGRFAKVEVEKAGVQLLQYPAGSGLTVTASAVKYGKNYHLTLAEDGSLAAEGEMPPYRIETTPAYRVLSLPLPADAGSSALRLFASRRTRPVLLPVPIDEEIVYNIALPASGKVVNGGEKAHLKNSVGEVDIRIETSGNKAVLHRSLRINGTEVPASRYSELSALLTLWHDANLGTLLLSR